MALVEAPGNVGDPAAHPAIVNCADRGAAT
jgi:hypothetical protein